MTAAGGTERIRLIRELMEQGLSFEDISARLMPSEDARPLRRLAWLRRIDLATMAIATVDAEGRGEGGVPSSLETLKRQGRLRELPGEPGVFTLAEGQREAQQKLWEVAIDPASGELSGRDQVEFRELNRRLADHFATLGAGAELDHLHHLLAADAGAGLDLMDALLRVRLPQADETTRGATDATLPGARDGIALGKAFDVLEVVGRQLAWLPAKMLDRYKSARRLVETWAEWCDAWYRTRRYVPRERIHRLFLDLLEQNQQRILEISAPGGSGKTMVLRWLITSHCIPRRKIVAHLDFDHFHGQQQRPWQLLLHCAEQLDRQLAGAPFQSLIGEGREVEAALRAQRDQANTLDEARLDTFAVELVHRFRSVLISSGQKTILFIVDTFEEAMIRGLTPVPAFIALLADLARMVPAIRIIVSGRYSLEHRGFSESLAEDQPAAAQFYKAHLRRERLRQFDAVEADLYLRRRGVELTKEQIERLMAASRTSPDSTEMSEEVSPFHLSLIADLIQGRGQEAGGLDFDDLLHDVSQVQVIYLIERVIARIDDVGVRWLLRYGVVPRHLTFEFFSEVLVPYLQKVHRGTSDLDDPGRDPLPEKLREKALFFTESQVLSEGPDQLWKRLEAFASADSWVEAVDGGKAFVFHTCARDPMRALLRSHKVLRAIHREAFNYFENRAATSLSPEAELAHLREVVYHRLQWQDPGALAFCRKLLVRHNQEERFDLLLGLGQEITSEEYRPADENPLVDEETLSFALQKRFDAAVALHDLESGSTQGNSRLEEARRTLIELAARGHDVSLPEAILEARHRTSLQKLAAAAVLLASATPSDEAKRSRAIAIDILGDGRCVELFRDLLAERLRDEKAFERPLTSFLFARTAASLRLFGSTEGTLATLETTLAKFTPGASQSNLIHAAAILLEGWKRPEAAAGLIARFGPPESPELRLVRIRALSSTDPQKALRELTALRQNSSLKTGDPSSDLLRGQTFRESAWLESQLADPEAAARSLAEAERYFLAAGNSDLAAQSRLIEAEIWLRHDQPELADEAMQRLLRSIYTGTGQETARSLPERMYLFEIAARSGDAAGDLAGLLEDAEKTDMLDGRLHCAFILLSFHPRPEEIRRRLADLVISSFEKLPDPLARSVDLFRLRQLRRQIRLDADQENRLLELLSGEEAIPLFGEVATGLDRAWGGLARAHLLRVIGRADRAHPLVREARKSFENASSLTGLREVWQLQALLEGEHPDVSRFHALRGVSPKLDEAIAIEQAEHALLRQDPAAAYLWLTGIDGPKTQEVHTRIRDLENAGTRWSLAFQIGDEEGLDGQAQMLVPGEEILEKGIGKPKWSTGTGPGGIGKPPEIPALPISDENSPWQVYPHQTLELGSAGRGSRSSWTRELIRFAVGHTEAHAIPSELIDGHRAAPHFLIDALARFPDVFSRDVFSTLLNEVLAPDRSVERRDLAVVGEHLGGAGVPWELGSADRVRLVYRRLSNERHRHLWLQIALRAAGFSEPPLSGEWDVATAKALRELANRLGTDAIGTLKRELRKAITKASASSKPRVVILQAAKRSQMKAQRGLDFGSAEIEKLYQRHGFQAETLFGVSLAEFLWANPRLPTIVHVYAPYVERTTTGDVLPDLGQEVPRGTPQLHPQELRDAIPLLILDGPGEPDPTEQVRQIFLRNAAATLFAKEGTFHHILGIGLDPQPDFRSLENLLDGILKGKSLYQLHHSLREGAPKLTAETLHKSSGRLAPALWTPDPDLSILLGDPP